MEILIYIIFLVSSAHQSDQTKRFKILNMIKVLPSSDCGADYTTLFNSLWSLLLLCFVCVANINIYDYIHY